jgi:hypothetical protein
VDKPVRIEAFCEGQETFIFHFGYSVLLLWLAFALVLIFLVLGLI